MVVEVLGEGTSITELGDGLPVEKEKPKSLTRQRNEDHNSVLVTGKTSDALTAEDVAEVKAIADNTVASSVEKVLAEGDESAPEALDTLRSQSNKAKLVSPEDFFAVQLRSLQNQEETDLESLTALKIQYTMQAIDEAVANRTNEYGGVVNFVDRFLVYEPFYESFLKFFGKSDFKLADQFTDAITGSMTFDEFKVFMDEQVNVSLGEGAFVEGNPQALEELRAIALSLGNQDPLTVSWMFAMLDVVPALGGGVKAAGKALVKGSEKAAAKAVVKAPEAVVKEVVESGPTVATQVGRAARSAEKAEEAAVKIAAKTDDPENVATLGPKALNPVSPKAPFHPTVQSGVADTTVKTLLRDVTDYVKRALSGGMDEARVSDFISARTQQLNSVMNRSLNNFAFDPLKGILKVTYGRADNGLGLSKRQAEEVAKKLPEAKVVPDGEGKFLVEVDQFVDPDALVKDLDGVEKITGLVSKISATLMKATGTLSTYARDTKLLSSMAERAETGVAKIAGKVQREIEADVKKLSAKEMDRVGSVISKLQSEELARQKTWLTEQQFSDEWAKDFGTPPSQKVIDGYNAIVKASNYSYAVRAGLLIGLMHRTGFRSINLRLGGVTDTYVGRQLDSLPDDAEFVVKAGSGELVRVKDLKDKPRNVFKVGIELEGGYGSTRYVIDTDSIKALEPVDVLGYNAGGPRINPDGDYFVTLMGEDGNVINVALSASTRKQAAKAQEQLDRLIKAVNDGSLTDDLVEANTEWNKLITTKDDFIKFLDDAQINPAKVDHVAYKMRDENVFRTGDDTFVPGASLDDFYMVQNKRNNKVLTHFGGERTYNENPVKSILSQVNTSSRDLAYSQYNQTALVSIGRKVKSIVNKDGGNKAYVGWQDRDYLDVLEEARFSSTSDPEITRLKELKRIFELRTGADGLGDQTIRNLTGWVSENIFKGRSKLGDPLNTANKFSFYATFLFDPFQTVMQGLHSTVVTTMAGPIDGPMGLMLGWDLMSSLKLKRGADLEAFYVTHSKKFGMTPDELKDTRELFVDMARYEITTDSLVEGFKEGGSGVLRPRTEAGRVAMHTTDKVWDVGSKYGMVFFNKGEQVSRVSAFGVAAIKRFKAKTGHRMNSPQSRDWVSAKEQAYSLRMTQTNKTAVQQGIGKAPFQFHSFMFKSFEGVMVGKGLTAGERLALFGMLAPIYGTVGMGLANSQPVVAALNHFLPPDQKVEPGSEAEEFVRRGMLDALASWAGVDTAIADRMSVIDGIQQLYHNFNEKTFTEFALGAGGGKTVDTATSLANSLSYFVRGDHNLAEMEMLEAFRQIKVVDSVVKAKNLYFHNILKTKTGKVIKGIDMPLAEQILVAAGLPMQKIEDLYNTDSIVYASRREVKEVGKEVDKLIHNYWLEDDPEKKRAHLNSAAALIEWSRLTDPQKDRMKKKFWSGPKGKGVSWKMYNDLVRMGLGYEAEQLAKTFSE